MDGTCTTASLIAHADPPNHRQQHKKSLYKCACVAVMKKWVRFFDFRVSFFRIAPHIDTGRGDIYFPTCSLTPCGDAGRPSLLHPRHYGFFTIDGEETITIDQVAKMQAALRRS